MAVKRNSVSKSTLTLAVGWMKDSVTTTAAQKQLKCGSISQTIYKLGIALREAARKGMIA